MSKVLYVFFALCLVQIAIAQTTQSSADADLDDKAPTQAGTAADSSTQEYDFGPAQKLIEGIYRRATIQALHSKVSELQTKILNGENAIPAAIDVLKITLLSDPAKNAIVKAAEHVISLMSPEVKALAPEAIAEAASITTPMPTVQST